jgi:hypothetical protein
LNGLAIPHIRQVEWLRQDLVIIDVRQQVSLELFFIGRVIFMLEPFYHKPTEYIKWSGCVPWARLRHQWLIECSPWGWLYYHWVWGYDPTVIGRPLYRIRPRSQHWLRFCPWLCWFRTTGVGKFMSSRGFWRRRRSCCIGWRTLGDI